MRATLFPALTLPARAATSGDYTYTVNDDGTTCTITEYNKYNGADPTIPATLDGTGVTSIGDSSFWGCSGLTSVTIPQSVRTC